VINVGGPNLEKSFARPYYYVYFYGEDTDVRYGIKCKHQEEVAKNIKIKNFLSKKFIKVI